MKITTTDNKEWTSFKEARAHQKALDKAEREKTKAAKADPVAHLADVLSQVTVEDVADAISYRNPALGKIIEDAGYLCRKNRLAAGVKKRELPKKAAASAVAAAPPPPPSPEAFPAAAE